MRLPVFDLLKFALMVMVVRGHLEGNGFFDPLNGIAYNLTIGVSMPLFFMISGFFAAKAFETNDNIKIVARITSFLWPLAAFGIIFGLTLFMFGKITFWKLLLYPAARVCGGSWFLSTLAMLYAIFAVVWKFAKRMKWRLAALSWIYLALFFLAGQGKVAAWLHLGDVLHMLPYFAFGVLVLKPFNLYKKWAVAIPCGIFFLLVIFFEGDVRANGMSFYWVPVDWQTVIADRRLFLCFWARSVVGITGGVFMLYVTERVLNVLPLLSYLAVFGTTSLGVYVMHEWPMIQIHKYVQFDPLSSYLRWPLVVMVFLFCHYVTMLIRGNLVLRFFFFGDEKWLSEVIKRWI